jgi:hypothetical protein
MDLTGRLSNPDLMALLQRLTARDWKQAARPHGSAGGIAPDERKFGTVRDAIVQVLAQPDSELRVRDIQKGVEEVLGGPVSSSSVKDYLRKGCRRRVPRFEYLGKRGYRLARSEGAGEVQTAARVRRQHAQIGRALRGALRRIRQSDRERDEGQLTGEELG